MARTNHSDKVVTLKKGNKCISQLYNNCLCGKKKEQAHDVKYNTPVEGTSAVPLAFGLMEEKIVSSLTPAE